MSRKKAEERREGGFGRMLAGTVALGLVFSAGLITGQRLLHRQALPPMVSLSSAATTDAPAAEADEPKKPLRTTFSFYEHLTNSKPEAKAPDEESPAEAEQPEPPPAEEKVDDSPTEVKAEAAPAPVEEPEEVAQATPEPAPKNATPPAAGTTIADAAAALRDAVDSMTEPAPQDALPARYTLQVSSHPSRESAERELDKLRASGVEPHVVTVDVPGKGTLYRVRVGKFHSMDEARHFQASLKDKRGVAGFVSPL